MTSSCAVTGCEQPYRAKGYCLLHYTRWHRHGDPLMVKPSGTPKGTRPWNFGLAYHRGVQV